MKDLKSPLTNSENDVNKNCLFRPKPCLNRQKRKTLPDELAWNCFKEEAKHLCKYVLYQDIAPTIDAVRAREKRRIPVVLEREKVEQVLKQMIPFESISKK